MPAALSHLQLEMGVAIIITVYRAWPDVDFWGIDHAA